MPSRSGHGIIFWIVGGAANMSKCTNNHGQGTIQQYHFHSSDNICPFHNSGFNLKKHFYLLHKTELNFSPVADSTRVLISCTQGFAMETYGNKKPRDYDIWDSHGQPWTGVTSLYRCGSCRTVARDQGSGLTVRPE